MFCFVIKLITLAGVLTSPACWWCHVQYLQPALSLHSALHSAQLPTPSRHSSPSRSWVLWLRSGQDNGSPTNTKDYVTYHTSETINAFNST